MYGLAFFHAVVQERRKFGPLGWNIPYGFDDGDLRISVRQLRMFIDENEIIPYDALNYVTGECNYGGRVTDDKDRLLLSTILANIYNPNTLTEEYKFTASGLYYAAHLNTMEEFEEFNSKLPINPLPEAFGLHENADITKDQNDTILMCKSLLSMSGSAGGGGSGGSAEDSVAAVVKDVIKRLPPAFDIEVVQRKYPVLYEQSMNTVIAQEMTRFNRLSAVVRKSMAELAKAIEGLVVMSSDMENAFDKMSVNQVPDLWRKASYPTMKSLVGYLDDLYARLGMLQTWCAHCKHVAAYVCIMLIVGVCCSCNVYTNE